ncbi:uncharacterized protein LOC134190149 [Corticium candelabrum]|uniref:uncharacterized protein LOC134190149 n=1 Tax=Corticium candelabrum TaxID=121492 RepID=UPI002E262D3D|nr:uncharacterized protein LOC134190149 [Corticium candelabrum]
MSKATSVVTVLSIAFLLAFVASDDVPLGVGKAQCFKRDFAENRLCTTGCTCHPTASNGTYLVNKCYVDVSLTVHFCPDSDENQLVIYWGDGSIYRGTTPVSAPTQHFDVSHHYSSNGMKEIDLVAISLLGANSCSNTYTADFTIKHC